MGAPKNIDEKAFFDVSPRQSSVFSGTTAPPSGEKKQFCRHIEVTLKQPNVLKLFDYPSLCCQHVKIKNNNKNILLCKQKHNICELFFGVFLVGV